MNSFNFLGKTFIPKRQFTKREENVGLRIVGRSTGIGNYEWSKVKGWNYEKFYIEAKKAGAGEIDIFLLDGKEVIPCENELFYKTERKIKDLLQEH